MHVAETIADCRRGIQDARRQGQTIGFVPTMGALHEGHLSLIEAARAEGGWVVVSIFVNPTQFDQKSDLDKYPRPIQQDAELCQKAGVNLLFVPSPMEMYPAGWSSGVAGRTTVRVLGLTDVLCGAHRPGHFDGVCTVVSKLFHIVQPDAAYFGQKDYQQAAIIRRMTCDLDFPVQIVVGPTRREPDGLAMSSRNVRLTPGERKIAPVLYAALSAAKQRILAGESDPSAALGEAKTMLAQKPPILLQYIELRDADTLTLPLVPLPPHGRWVIALAAFLGDLRLIDNIVVER